MIARDMLLRIIPIILPLVLSFQVFRRKDLRLRRVFSILVMLSSRIFGFTFFYFLKELLLLPWERCLLSHITDVILSSMVAYIPFSLTSNEYNKP